MDWLSSSDRNSWITATLRMRLMASLSACCVLSFLGPPGLHPQHRGDGLQVVLDPVMHLLDHGRLDLELLLLAALLGGVVDHDQHAADVAAGPHGR